MNSYLQTLLEAVSADENFKLTASQLGELADTYNDLRTQRLAADKVAAELKAQESAAQELLIQQFRSQEVSGAGGQTVRVSMDSPDYVPHVKDWDKFYEHILKSKDFSLLERRPGRAHAKALWEDGVEIPGVEKFPVYKLKVSKVK